MSEDGRPLFPTRGCQRATGDSGRADGIRRATRAGTKASRTLSAVITTPYGPMCEDPGAGMHAGKMVRNDPALRGNGRGDRPLPLRDVRGSGPSQGWPWFEIRRGGTEDDALTHLGEFLGTNPLRRGNSTPSAEITVFPRRAEPLLEEASEASGTSAPTRYGHGRASRLGRRVRRGRRRGNRQGDARQQRLSRSFGKATGSCMFRSMAPTRACFGTCATESTRDVCSSSRPLDQM